LPDALEEYVEEEEEEEEKEATREIESMKNRLFFLSLKLFISKTNCNLFTEDLKKKPPIFIRSIHGRFLSNCLIFSRM